jgi:hypothetical protein
MLLLTALLPAALTSAETPKYCGRAGSGVDELRAPQTEASLKSVQVVARHGARAPVADCGRWLPAAAGAAWTCPGEAVEGVSSGSAYRLRSGVKDECGPGELLEEGFAQHRALGRALREAYWAPGAIGRLPTDHITLRSSDLPRTRRSAEALADAFAPSADPRDLRAPAFATDWIYPNSNECPALAVLERAAFAAPAFVARNATDLGALAAKLAPAIGGGPVDFGLDDGMAGGHLMDCAAAAACSGRAFAPPPDDVDALIAAMERREASKLTPRYSRTVTSPLVAALRARLVNSTGLSVFLAHDTTLMPLLVAITTDYDGAWAPYAAAVVVETWTLPGGSDAVRVAYDGAYRTLAGCPSQELCPVDDFLAATAWVRDRDCSIAPRVGSLRVDAGDAPVHGSSIAAFAAGAAAALLANAWIQRGGARML